MSKPVALIIITPGFPENEADSTCVPPQQIFVKALKEVAPLLAIIVLTYQYPFLSAQYQWHGVTVYSFGSKKNSRLSRLVARLRVRHQLEQLNKTHAITGVLSFWFGKAAWMGHTFGKKYKLPHYCWLLGQDAKAGNKYVNKIKPAAESLIALSDFIAREFNKNYGVLPAHTIPVGIDTGLFSTDATERPIDVLGVGSLIPLKQYPVFLEMIRLLKEFVPTVNAVICGDGPESGYLEAMAGTLDLTANVSFYGRLPHASVLALMQQSKIFLHPSAYEGFGAVCTEALYAGAHVISFVQPMDMPIKNWHVAGDKAGMLKLLVEKLRATNLNHDAVLPFTIQDNAKSMLKLFNYNEAATS
jgi:glycosyltransferase involved in cell wall biosynthesis